MRSSTLAAVPGSDSPGPRESTLPVVGAMAHPMDEAELKRRTGSLEAMSLGVGSEGLPSLYPFGCFKMKHNLKMLIGVEIYESRG